MKKILMTSIVILSATFASTAQEISTNAIGLRFGGAGEGAGGEISYQKNLENNNRLEIDLGLTNKFINFKATGLYQWVWTLEERFNWYAGAGGGLVSAGSTGIYAAGVIGIEYNFKVPILLSIDYRPEIGVAGGLNGLESDIALSVRYQF